MSAYIGPVKVFGPVAVYSAQETVGTSAAALSAQILSSGGAVLKSDSENTGDIYLGPPGVTTSTGYKLNPSDAVPVNVDNLSSLHAIATEAGQKLYILGT